MVILSLQFNNSEQTYDYLLKNKKHNKICITKPLKMVKGCGKGGLIIENAELKSIREVTKVPINVTSLILVMENNYIRAQRLTQNELKQLCFEEVSK